jgi:hypothetical protein
MLFSRALANGGKGAVFEEENAGDVSVAVINSQTDGNDDGDKTGLELVQDDAGSGVARIVNTTAREGIDAEGVRVE